MLSAGEREMPVAVATFVKLWERVIDVLVHRKLDVELAPVELLPLDRITSRSTTALAAGVPDTLMAVKRSLQLGEEGGVAG